MAMSEPVVTGERKDSSSIELTLNAKHEYQPTVKVYFDASEPDGWQVALLKVVQIEKRLHDRYVSGLNRDLVPELQEAIDAVRAGR